MFVRLSVKMGGFFWLLSIFNLLLIRKIVIFVAKC